MGNTVQLNKKEIKSQLGEMVRQTVEETLNAILDAEVDAKLDDCLKTRPSQILCKPPKQCRIETL